MTIAIPTPYRVAREPVIRAKPPPRPGLTEQARAAAALRTASTASATELQPADCLWPIVNEGVANRTFKTLPELITSVEGRLRHMDEDREAVGRKTAYYWWPKEPPIPV